jgi:hypothetical protein
MESNIWNQTGTYWVYFLTLFDPLKEKKEKKRKEKKRIIPDSGHLLGLGILNLNVVRAHKGLKIKIRHKSVISALKKCL